MKKVLVFALVVVMLFAVPATVLADGFVSSPSLNKAPAVESGDVTVTGYGDKATLTEAQQTALTAAYDSIAAATDVSKLAGGLATIAGDKKLAVADLFDITSKGEGPVTISLKSDAFKNFVALLHYTDGKWEIVDAKLSGTTLTFTVDSFSPFAVVVSTDAQSPETSDALPISLIALAMLFGAAGVYFVKKSA